MKHFLTFKGIVSQAEECVLAIPWQSWEHAVIPLAALKFQFAVLDHLQLPVRAITLYGAIFRAL
jgi:hypothetical protein